jgi:hypothetical protein
MFVFINNLVTYIENTIGKLFLGDYVITNTNMVRHESYLPYHTYIYFGDISNGRIRIKRVFNS